MEEEWRPVKDYEGLYEVSNLGRVKSVNRTAYNSIGFSYKIHERILSPLYGTNGYPHVTLYKNGSAKNNSIHRLVAEAFIPNPNNYPIINHKDETRTNNCVDNLEWCTYYYNNNYGNTKLKKSIANRGKSRSGVPRYSKRKPVYKYNTNFELVKRYESLSEAVAIENSSMSNIGLAIKMGTIRCGGYYWSFNDPKTVDTSFFKKSRFINKWGLRGDNI